jgi:hypothetical protein
MKDFEPLNPDELTLRVTYTEGSNPRNRGSFDE